MQIDNKDELIEYYTRENIVNKYIGKRFVEPIFIVEHKKQVSFVNYAINKYNLKNPLELAPGPARLTIEIKSEKGVGLDSSERMLRVAEKRMAQLKKKWKFVKGDAFNLKFNSQFDLVFSFRFITHFKEKERLKLYSQIRKALKKDGYLVFEAYNEKKVRIVRSFVGKKKYPVYDKLYSEPELIGELTKNGFKVIKVSPVISHFWTQMFISKFLSFFKLNKLSKDIISKIERIKSKNPYEWVILCQKI